MLILILAILGIVALVFGWLMLACMVPVMIGSMVYFAIGGMSLLLSIISGIGIGAAMLVGGLCLIVLAGFCGVTVNRSSK